MMRNLLLDEGDLLQVESASLPVATFSKFQPQSEDFLDITNPKAVLENALRNFACLTSGDVVAITYNDHVYELRVLETKPGNAVSIIECDMNVEFAAPVGYSEPTRIKKEEDGKDEVMDTFDPSQFTPEVEGFVAFTGSGIRYILIWLNLIDFAWSGFALFSLDGKPRKQVEPETAPKTVAYQRGIPDYDYEIGTLRFLRFAKAVEDKEMKEDSQFEAFSGSGQSLRPTKTLKWFINFFSVRVDLNIMKFKK